MERKKELMDEVKDSVEIFIYWLFEKKLIADINELAHIQHELEDFVFEQIEEKRSEILKEVRERIEGQLSEAER